MNIDLPPHDPDAETDLVGSVILMPEKLEAVLPLVKPRDFYLGTNRAIYAAVCKLHDEGRGITVESVTDAVLRGRWDCQEPIEKYLTRMLDRVPHGAHAVYHAEQVLESSRKRNLVYAASQMIRNAHDPETSADQLYEDLREAEPPPMGAMPIDAVDLMKSHPRLREPLVDGLLRRGETMNVIAATKTGKSWLSLDLALAVATGRPWLGHAVKRGNVLLVDNELHRETLASRLRTVSEARSIDQGEFAGFLKVQPMRGQLCDIFELGTFFRRLPGGLYSLVILDCWYKFTEAGVSENDNAAAGRAYSRLDSYANDLGCGFVAIHHSSKGSQADKAVTDVGSGAGAMSRAADTHCVLRPHAESDHVVLEAATRSWAPVLPKVLRWNFPAFDPVDGMDAEQLRKQKTQQQLTQENNDREGEAAVLKALASESLTSRKIRSLTGFGPARAERLIGRLLTSGRIERISFGGGEVFGIVPD